MEKLGPITFETLYSPDAKANILSFGQENDVVLKYQQKLETLAYLTTEPDGKYGKDTTAAVKLFQEKNGLVVDGYLGPANKRAYRLRRCSAQCAQHRRLGQHCAQRAENAP